MLGWRDAKFGGNNHKQLLWTSEFESLGLTFKCEELKDITEMRMKQVK